MKAACSAGWKVESWGRCLVWKKVEMKVGMTWKDTLMAPTNSLEKARHLVVNWA